MINLKGEIYFMKVKNLNEMLQTATRQLLNNPNYLEDLIMAYFETNGKMPIFEIVEDAKCPKDVRKYLSEEASSLKKLFEEAKYQALDVLSQEQPLLSKKKIQISRLFLDSTDEELKNVDDIVEIPIVSLIVKEIKFLQGKSNFLDKYFDLQKEDAEIMHRIKYYLG